MFHGPSWEFRLSKYKKAFWKSLFPLAFWLRLPRLPVLSIFFVTVFDT